jgi:hypothetical protein
MTIEEYFEQLPDSIFDNAPDTVALYQNVKDINFESKLQHARESKLPFSGVSEYQKEGGLIKSSGYSLQILSCVCVRYV